VVFFPFLRPCLHFDMQSSHFNKQGVQELQLREREREREKESMFRFGQKETNSRFPSRLAHTYMHACAPSRSASCTRARVADVTRLAARTRAFPTHWRDEGVLARPKSFERARERYDTSPRSLPSQPPSRCYCYFCHVRRATRALTRASVYVRESTSVYIHIHIVDASLCVR